MNVDQARKDNWWIERWNNGEWRKVQLRGWDYQSETWIILDNSFETTIPDYLIRNIKRTIKVPVQKFFHSGGMRCNDHNEVIPCHINVVTPLSEHYDKICKPTGFLDLELDKHGDLKRAVRSAGYDPDTGEPFRK